MFCLFFCDDDDVIFALSLPVAAVATADHYIHIYISIMNYELQKL
jgi:hypothetical protein